MTVLSRLVDGTIAGRVAAGDATLWPQLARPGWTGALRGARPLVGEIEALREQRRVAGQIRVVLATSGGVGVAAEALTAADPRLVVLDTTDPAQVADAVAGELAATVLVVSVPPGEDAGPVQLLRDTVHDAFRAEGLDPAAHTVVVTPPHGPLLPAEPAGPGGTVVILGPDDVDGPWAAFTAYALVPAGLAGADVGAALADATGARDTVTADSAENPALAIGALLADAPAVALAAGSPARDGASPALAEWVAQLVAGGLGKDGRGPLPVLVEGPDAPEWERLPALGVGDVAGAALSTHGSAATQMLEWQHAVAVAAHVLAVDPTDRPDARDTPPATDPTASVAFTDGAVEVRAGDWLPAGTSTVADALRALTADTGGAAAHLAVHAYLDRIEDASTAVLRSELARRTGLPTTFGWAPRCLPGGGQHAKGARAQTRVCQLTGTLDDASDDPAHTDALDAVQRRLAQDDAAALAARGRPVLRLHFIDRVAGLVTLAHAVQEL